MSNTIELLSKLVSTEALDTIGKSAKVSKKDVGNVLSTALPVLLTGMQNNSSTKAGAASLEQALADHAKADTSDVASFLKNADVEDGQKILAHVLGNENEDVQKAIAERAKEKGITNVVFDRGGFRYFGRVKALADAAREAGLEF